jgi:hypothetical protein
MSLVLSCAKQGVRALLEGHSYTCVALRASRLARRAPARALSRAPR